MNQDKIWEAYQNDPELQSMGCREGGRINFIAKQIQNKSKVLNIGVGRGTLERLLVKQGIDIHCLDPSDTSISSLKNELGLDEKAKVGYSQEIPYEDAYFDCVVMTEVLEHLADDILQSTLDEVFRVLNAGGMFIGSVPADEQLIDNIVVCPKCGERFHRWGHQQSFSRERLVTLLANKSDNVVVRRIVFYDFASLNWKGKISSFLRSIQAHLGKKGTDQNFYFKAIK